MNIISPICKDFLRAILWCGVCDDMKEVARPAKVQILSPSRTVGDQMHIIGVKEPPLSPEAFRAAVAPARGACRGKRYITLYASTLDAEISEVGKIL
jgi:hypothetical protein